jgi:hypothetical protein
LAPGQKFSVSGAPTHFGPVSYWLEAFPNEIRGSVTLPTRNSYRNAWLNMRLPDGKKIVWVRLDGKVWQDVDKGTGRVRLPHSKRPIRLLARIGS